MRVFLQLLIAAWLLGTVVGVSGTAGVAVWLPGLALALGLRFMRQQAAAVLAVSSVMLLGWVLGRGSMTVANCEPSMSPVTVRIESAVERLDGTRYVVRDNSGCLVMVYTTSFPRFWPGQEVLVSSGRVQRTEEFTGEQEGYGMYLRRRGVAAVWQRAELQLLEGRPTPLAYMQKRVQQVIEASFPEPDASLVTAMLLGQQGTIPERIVEQFRRTGVSHVLAISGSNIILIAGGLYFGLLLLPLPRLFRGVCATVMLWIYIVLIGAPLSGVRAALFWTTGLLLLQCRRLLNVPTVVALALAITVTVNPAVWFDVGWQLSFAAVLGIWVGVWLTNKTKGWQRVVAATLGTTMGAIAATWPIVAYQFGSVSLIAPVANILIVPASSVLLVVGAAAAALGAISPILGMVGAYGVHAVVGWMDGVTAWLAAVPGAAIDGVRISAGVVAWYYVALLIVVAAWAKTTGRSWRELYG